MIRKCLFPAAGYGPRVLPASKAMPADPGQAVDPVQYQGGHAGRYEEPRHCGCSILTSDIFDILRRTPPGKNGKLQLTDAPQTQARENRALAYKFAGRGFDCGSVTSFVDVTNYFFRQRLGDE